MKEITDFVLKGKYKNILDNKCCMVIYKNTITITIDTSNRYWHAKSRSLVKDIRKAFPDVEAKLDGHEVLIMKR